MLFKKSVMTAAVFAVGSFAVMSANAADSGSFTVAMTVAKSCVVTAGDNIALTAKTDATAPIGSSIVKVACSLDTPYSVSMTPTTGSTNTGESKGTLKGTSGNLATLDYQLATDAAGATPWAAGATGNATTGGTGTGTTEAKNKSFTVYAKVTGDKNLVLPDVYSDTVTIGVNY
ncbi:MULTISPECIES: spore coat protein U domain-containing protein [unclassified Psychrobacter]|uniref:spore coat protein U domain-containing protein n=1 Tax=unclassified Psychrobacter TaxID=196806 RepID=UPI00191875F6|nr:MULTISPECIES: spore coat protein U domain-containing protein [unclassified Psychrobacter]